METGNSGQRTFESKLPQGKQRLLAHLIEHGFEVKVRTPEDFIRHFPPTAIMEALAKQPELRANILELTVGVRRKVALKKSPESSGQDLQIALDEGETDAETIVSLLQPDDRIRYLDAKALWKYITENKFWLTAPSDAEAFGRAKQHMVFLLERSLRDKLIAAKDIVEGITVPTLVEHLPKAELVSLLDEALAKGRSGKPFSDDDLLETTGCFTIAEHVSFPALWNGVIEKRLAMGHGLVEKPATDAPPSTSSASSSKDKKGNSVPSAVEAANDDKDAGALFDETEVHPTVDDLEDVEFDELLESIQADDDEPTGATETKGKSGPAAVAGRSTPN